MCIPQGTPGGYPGSYIPTPYPEPAAGHWPNDTPTMHVSTDIRPGVARLNKISAHPAKPGTRLSDLQDLSQYKPAPLTNMGEDYRHPKLYEWAHQNLYADDNVATTHRDI